MWKNPLKSNVAVRLGISLAVAVLLIQIGPALPSPQNRQASIKSLQHEVSVTLKLIQVFVTDKSGGPVLDLTKDEFTLTDNGNPVTISAFEKHELPAAVKVSDVHAPETDAAPAVTVAPILSRKFIILFDFAFNTARGIVASLEAVRQFLEAQVRPGDELALISYSAIKGLRIHEFFTTDQEKLKAALRAVTAKDVAGRADEVEHAYWTLVERMPGSSELANLEMQRRDSTRQAQEYFDSLTRLAKALRLVQGEKNILFFSSGVPSSLISSSRLGGIPGNGFPTFEIGVSLLRPLLEEMLKEFSASNCTFYAFDTRDSTKIPALFDVDELNLRIGGGILGADGKVFRDDKTTGMDSLRRLSSRTGGKYYSNIALHEKNLEEVSAATGAYYVLGYPITMLTDGQFHNIKIEVTRKGCQVRAQPGYFNPKPFSEYSQIERNIHLFDLALNEPSEFQTPITLPISTLSYDAGNGLRVRALVRIHKEVWERFIGHSAEIVALFFDARDVLVSLQRIAVPLAEYRAKNILFTASAAAQQGSTKCRIIIRDLDTGKSAIAAAIAYPGPSGRRDLSVFSPLLIVEGGGLFLLESVVKGVPESASWRSIYSYDAAAFSPVIDQEPVPSVKIGVILPYSVPGADVSEVTFRANLVNVKTGESLPVPLEMRESSAQGIVQIQKFVISLEKITNGQFLLYIHVGNKVTRQVSSVWTPIGVEY